MPFIPHTKQDIEQMLKSLNIKSIDDLFAEIPTALRSADLTSVPAGLNELEVTQLMQERAEKNFPKNCFIGAGAYEHFIPACVWDIVGRGEFYTAYTPYQAEASQGSLQLIYEYQTMMANLMGMDISNASLYDGATALAEAVLMSVRIKSDAKKILMPKTVNPFYRQVVQALTKQQGIEIEEIPYDVKSGATDLSYLKKINTKDYAALVIPQPNFLGALEEVDELTDFAHQQNLLVIAVVNPLAMALLKEPGQWGQTGADIACGEGQPLGIPLASGGPYFGFLCCKKEYVRQLPGRIVGRTQDKQGREGYCLTLQTREQHIRRAKATSNICTNQGLMVTAATIYLTLMGAEGLRRVAMASHDQAVKLRDLLKSVAGIETVFINSFFNEFVIRSQQPAKNLLDRLSQQGIQGGYSLGTYYPELGESILVCATETKTLNDLTHYQQCLNQILKNTMDKSYVVL